MNPVLQAALNFHDAGVSVVPTRADGSKAPIGHWKEFQTIAPTRQQIVDWFSNSQVQGLGVITGAVSGNLEMVEFEGRAIAADMHHQARDLAENSGLGELWEILVNGYVEVTPSGGLHFLYRIADEPVPGNTKIARRPGDNDGVEVLIETRGEGGFVVTAPSFGTTHPTGQPWTIIKGSAMSIPLFTWEERNAIHSIFKALDAMPQKESIAAQLSTKDSTSDKPGDIYNAQVDWKDILEPRGWRIVYTSNGITYWRRPGKDQGISATTKADTGNLFVFTTSTTFEAEKPYSKFAAYTHLEHGGDFSRAASALRALGYKPADTNSFSLPSLNPMPLLSAVPKVDNGVDEESSWKPVDLHQFFDGSYKPVETSLLMRSDGHYLLYPGKVHSFYGESESGKSWIAQIAVAEQLRQFKKVTYIDFESDAADLVFRLQALKVTQAEILQNFTYIRPDAARDHTDPFWLQLLEPGSSSLIIIDGVTEALTMWGGETKDNDQITRWMRQFPRAIAEASGACVVQIDHVTKNAETRGRFAIGGQAKLATIDGAAYLIEPLEALAPGRTGSVTIRVTKDRPGFIRKIAGLYRKTDRTQEAAVITIDSTRPQMEYVIAPPLMEDQLIANQLERLDHEIVTFIDSAPGATKSMATRGIKGQDSSVLARLEVLIRDGILENQGNERGYKLYVSDLGKEKFNLTSAMILHIGEAQ